MPLGERFYFPSSFSKKCLGCSLASVHIGMSMAEVIGICIYHTSYSSTNSFTTGSIIEPIICAVDVLVAVLWIGINCFLCRLVNDGLVEDLHRWRLVAGLRYFLYFLLIFLIDPLPLTCLLAFLTVVYALSWVVISRMIKCIISSRERQPGTVSMASVKEGASESETGPGSSLRNLSPTPAAARRAIPKRRDSTTSEPESRHHVCIEVDMPSTPSLSLKLPLFSSRDRGGSEGGASKLSSEGRLATPTTPRQHKFRFPRGSDSYSDSGHDLQNLNGKIGTPSSSRYSTPHVVSKIYKRRAVKFLATGKSRGLAEIVLNNRHDCMAYSTSKRIRNVRVLETVFSYCSARDLKNFRKVCKLWNETSVLELVNRRLLKVKIRNVRQSLHEVARMELIDLNNHFRNSNKIFPITILDLEMEAWDDHLQESGAHAVENFLELFGSKIKKIVLSSSSQSEHPIEKLEDLLLLYCPNVEELLIEDIGFYKSFNIRSNRSSLARSRTLNPNDLGSNDTETHCEIEKSCVRLFDENADAHFQATESIHVPFLERISFGPIQYISVFKDLLEAAPNLKEILNFKMQLLDVIKETGKIDCIKKFRYDFDGKDAKMASTMLSKFADCDPKLEILEIFQQKVKEKFQSQDYANLRKILVSSKDTIKSLTCYPYSFLKPIENSEETFPIFYKLKKLQILYPKYENQEFGSPILPHGPGGDDLTKIFPCVETIEIGPNLNQWKVKNIPFYFRNNTASDLSFDFDLIKPWKSVRKLVLKTRCEVDKFGWEILKHLFPNVNHFQANEVISLFSTEESEWSLPWESLEIIELRGFVFQHGFLSSTLDSLFTGIPKRSIKYEHVDEVDEDAGDLQDKTLGTSNLEKQGNITGEPGKSITEEKNKKKEELEKEKHDKILKDLKIFKVKKAISDFQHLREVRIIFDSDLNLGLGLPRDPWNSPVVSQLSWDYGFSLLPKLCNVTFGYDQDHNSAKEVRDLLDPLAKFVSLVHEPLKSGSEKK